MARLVRLVHSVAVQGFDAKSAALYAKARPGYARDAVEHAVNAAGFGRCEKLHCVEVGAGTGKFTESLLDYKQEVWPTVDLKLTAVEPSDGFRNELSKSFGMRQGLSVEAGSGEALTSIKTQQSVDAIFVAQAFHWMANVSTLREFHRVLKPGAPLILLWNALDMSVPWISSFEKDVLDKYYQPPDIPRYVTFKWPSVFNAPSVKGVWFGEPVRWFGGYQRFKATKQQFVERVTSISVIASKSEAEKKIVEDEVLELLATHPDTKGVPDGEIEVTYKSEVCVVKRK